MKAADSRGKRFSILGAARSGVAVAGLLRQHGAEVFLSERNPREKAADAVRELEAMGVGAEFGGHTQRVLDADVVVLSPGVPSDLPVVRDALSRGVPVLSEIEVAGWFCRAPIIGITGTNGKTTTTALTGRMFEDARRPSVVAGNIGLAFSQVAETLGPEGVAVLEVSSFQLDHIRSFRPRVAVWLNVTPDHLDRYGQSYEKYVASKSRIFENQGEGDALVYNADDAVVSECVRSGAPASVTRLAFSVHSPVTDGAYLQGRILKTQIGGSVEDVVAADHISIRGIHNLSNAMAATLAAKAMNLSTASIRATLKNFKGVEHRLESVETVNGVLYVNDSKATNVDSVWYALQSFDRPLVLLLGGRDKGNDYTRLVDLVRRNVRVVVAIGESAEKVVRFFAPVVPVLTASSMEEAVRQASTAAHAGDAVLLSPACASFDWFENYEHRGRVFKEIVSRLKGA